MCGRYSLNSDSLEIKQRFGLREEPLVSPQENIPPGMMLPVIPLESPDRVVLAKWGLIPRWAKDSKIGYKMINARAETVALKPAFRKPLISGRCLIPASGFYEWKSTEGGKVPYYISVTDSPLFAFAGLYDEWIDAEGRPLKTFTIITTEPNELLLPIHNRMPVILNREGEKIWLNPDISDPGKLKEILMPYDADKMIAEKISSFH